MARETMMSDGSIDIRHEARARVYAEPLESLNPAQPDLFAGDAFGAWASRPRWPVNPR